MHEKEVKILAGEGDKNQARAFVVYTGKEGSKHSQ